MTTRTPEQKAHLLAVIELERLIREKESEYSHVPSDHLTLHLNAGQVRTLARMIREDRATISQQSDEIDALHKTLGKQLVEEWRARDDG